MVEGGPIHVLTGDYLAELTLSILHKDRQKSPDLGYAKTFPLQLKGIAGACLERGIKIVVNAGGLNPAACAKACADIYRELGLQATVAHLEGDDLLPRLDELQAEGETLSHMESSRPLKDLTESKVPILSANAYLGARGIAQALELGADLVICPRVTDASLVVGPAVWWHGWSWDSWDELASAVVAGHILECGAQASGGNFSGFQGIPNLRHPGFPLAEIHADGSFVVTKHPSSSQVPTDGAVTVDTVTAQLLYEIEGSAYLNPDVTAYFHAARLIPDGPDRVRVEGTRGGPPPKNLKVCINHFGGYKNSVTFLLSGLHINEKAALAEETLFRCLAGKQSFDDVRVTLNKASSTSEYDASFSSLRVAVKDRDASKVGRRFSAAAVEMALASYPGFNLIAPPGREQPFTVYWPALVSRNQVREEVHISGEIHPVTYWRAVPGTPTTRPIADGRAVPGTPTTGTDQAHDLADSERPQEQVPLGYLAHARSGDKGGNVNVGFWAVSDIAWPWLEHSFTEERFAQLLNDRRDLQIRRYTLPNLKAVNFVVHGFLGDGVASSLAVDAQGKGLGEFLRAQTVAVPEALAKRLRGKVSLPPKDPASKSRNQRNSNE